METRHTAGTAQPPEAHPPKAQHNKPAHTAHRTHTHTHRSPTARGCTTPTAQNTLHNPAAARTAYARLHAATRPHSGCLWVGRVLRGRLCRSTPAPPSMQFRAPRPPLCSSASLPTPTPRRRKTGGWRQSLRPRLCCAVSGCKRRLQNCAVHPCTAPGGQGVGGWRVAVLGGVQTVQGVRFPSPPILSTPGSWGI